MAFFPLKNQISERGLICWVKVVTFLCSNSLLYSKVMLQQCLNPTQYHAYRVPWVPFSCGSTNRWHKMLSMLLWLCLNQWISAKKETTKDSTMYPDSVCLPQNYLQTKTKNNDLTYLVYYQRGGGNFCKYATLSWYVQLQDNHYPWNLLRNLLHTDKKRVDRQVTINLIL